MKKLLIITGFGAAILLLVNCTGQQKGETLSADEKKTYLEKGKSIAQETFAALSGQLSEALAEKGVSGAMEYCSLAALPIVDSLSKIHNAEIRRTSLKVRNPKDRPTDWELNVLRDFEEAFQQGKDIKPVVQKTEDQQIAFAAPIYIKPLCLQCHGTIGQELAVEDLPILRKLYPEDEAIGYKAGDLRGMWSITFYQKDQKTK